MKFNQIFFGTVNAYTLVHELIARHRIRVHVLLLGKRPFFAPK